jgi:hypothetical protein
MPKSNPNVAKARWRVSPHIDHAPTDKPMDAAARRRAGTRVTIGASA